MSKTLRTAALIVGAVALVGTGIGAAAGAGIFGTVAAGSATAAALATVATVTAYASLAAVGLTLAAAVTAKKPPGGTQTGNPQQFTADPNAFVPCIVGQFATSGVLAFRKTYDTADDGTNDRRAMVVILSLGLINSILSFTADRTAVTFDADGYASAPYVNYMWQKTQLGASPEAAALDFGLTAGTPPTWDSSRKLSGLAAAAWTVRFDPQAKVYQTGMPNPRWVIEGVMVYDPRLDSTYPGGSGSHRWDDESTWTYSENAHLHALSYVIGRHQNGKRVFGIGAPISQIDVASFVDGANISDLNGWKAAGAIYSGDGKWDTLKRLLQAGMAEPMQLGALISCFTNAPKVSLDTVTTADVVGAASAAATQPRRDRINGIVPRYWQPGNDWQFLPGEAVRVSAYESTDGGRRTKEADYAFIPEDHIGTACRYDIENAREFGPISLPLKIRWIGYKPGDCITVTLPEIGLVSQQVLLLNRDFDPVQGVASFTARSETYAKHAFALGQTTVAPPTPGVSLDPSIPTPQSGSWAITDNKVTTTGDPVPAIVIEGAVDTTVAESIVFEYRIYDAGAGPDDNWIVYAETPPPTLKTVITSVQPTTSYEAAVSYRRRGFVGERLVLGPVTTETPVYPTQQTTISGEWNTTITVTLDPGASAVCEGKIKIATSTLGGTLTAELQYSASGTGIWNNFGAAGSDSIAPGDGGVAVATGTLNNATTDITTYLIRLNPSYGIVEGPDYSQSYLRVTY
ncbi:MAG: hypothetical protein ABW043_16750 [Devosia sp.]|uniref:hypothetical protein n=1 Tax=Devosia sp. TaxID=1871048 RepID=UPI0033959998